MNRLKGADPQELTSTVFLIRGGYLGLPPPCVEFPPPDSCSPLQFPTSTGPEPEGFLSPCIIYWGLVQDQKER